jgi:flagellar biosynthesis protein FlhA
VEHSVRGLFVSTPTATDEKICDATAGDLTKMTRQGKKSIVLVSATQRARLKKLTGGNLPRLVVLSFNEITRDTKVEIVGIVNEA